MKTSTKLAKLDQYMETRWPEFCRQRAEKVWPRPSLSRLMELGRQRFQSILASGSRGTVLRQ
jgi:hypothetical protein